jgi:tetratricopeptide (TPR) repeat protein
VIGRFVGEGGERIVHELVNARSRLSLHVIKVLKDQESAPAPSRRLLESYRRLRDAGVPVVEDPELVHAHGGWFELDEAATLESDPHHALIEQVRRAYDSGDPGSAEGTSRQLLALAPDHTEALHYLALALAQRGDLAGAITVGRKILSVEPNIRPYRFNLMEWAAGLGLFESFGTMLAELKNKWPGERRADALAAEVALARGRPEQAQDLYLVESSDLRRRVTAEAAAATRAETSLARAAWALAAGRPDEVLRHCAAAYAEYPKSPVVAVNYGLALLRSHDWQHGYEALSSVVSAAPPLFKSDALAAIAVCLAHLGDYARAAALLEHAAATMASPDGSIADADLPTVPVWVTYDRELQPRDNPIGPVIDDIIGHLRDSRKPVPPSLLTLRHRYSTGRGPVPEI